MDETVTICHGRGNLKFPKLRGIARRCMAKRGPARRGGARQGKGFIGIIFKRRMAWPGVAGRCRAMRRMATLGLARNKFYEE